MPRSSTSISLSQVRVGIFVLLGIVVLIFLILNASGDINPFSRKLHLKARFVDANGLREGSEVRLAGVRVGKVERIVLLEPSPVPGAPRVEAQLTVDSTIDGRPANERIRSDSQAQQGSPSLLGNEMLINITDADSTAKKDAFKVLPAKPVAIYIEAMLFTQNVRGIAASQQPQSIVLKWLRPGAKTEEPIPPDAFFHDKTKEATLTDK